VVKIPFSEAGLVAARHFCENNIPCNVTAVMGITQAIAAMASGARYVSVICGRIQDSNGSAGELLKQLIFRIRQEQRSTQVIAASLRQPSDVARALTAGAHIVTVSPEVLRKSLQNPATDQMIADFDAAG
jgi:transaldolase